MLIDLCELPQAQFLKILLSVEKFLSFWQLDGIRDFTDQRAILWLTVADDVKQIQHHGLAYCRSSATSSAATTRHPSDPSQRCGLGESLECVFPECHYSVPGSDTPLLMPFWFFTGIHDTCEIYRNWVWRYQSERYSYLSRTLSSILIWNSSWTMK